MCDTMIALGSSCAGGRAIFAKNSDREPDEAQNLVFRPRRSWPHCEDVKCTYITIPQAPTTNAVLLSQPFWMWGAEMGVNEFGVAIGNETIFAWHRPGDVGLTGMDLVRLGLERGATAAQARDVIIKLLEEHGQGGNCGYRNRLHYNNGFLIADPTEAFVLETWLRHWVWRRVEDVGAISNFISMDRKFDGVDAGFIEAVKSMGRCGSRKDFNFKSALTEPVFTHFAYGQPRAGRSHDLLNEKKGGLGPADFFRILRDHGTDPAWSPHRQKSGTLCMHAADNLFRPSATTGSLVAVLKPDPIVYVTGSSNPCLSPFFPARVAEGGLPRDYAPAGAEYSNDAWWWVAEKYHRRALPRFAAAHAAAISAIETLEAEMLSDTSDGADREKVDKWFGAALDMARQWGGGLDDLPAEKLPFLYRRYWAKRNRWNKIEA